MAHTLRGIQAFAHTSEVPRGEGPFAVALIERFKWSVLSKWPPRWRVSSHLNCLLYSCSIHPDDEVYSIQSNCYITNTIASKDMIPIGERGKRFEAVSGTCEICEDGLGRDWGTGTPDPLDGRMPDGAASEVTAGTSNTIDGYLILCHVQGRLPPSEVLAS